MTHRQETGEGGGGSSPSAGPGAGAEIFLGRPAGSPRGELWRGRGEHPRGHQARSRHHRRRAGRARVRTLRRDGWWRSPHGHGRGADGVRHLCDVGGVPEPLLLRRRRGAPEPHLPALLPLHHGELRAGVAPGPCSASGGVSPALLILVVPGGFRLTCYYYRKAYYRGFWQSPPACGVADAHPTYTGESRFPLILQNVHRYFFYLAPDLQRHPHHRRRGRLPLPGQGIGMSVGTLVLVVNAVFLWLYTLSCHAGRHLCGGGVNVFSEHPSATGSGSS